MIVEGQLNAMAYIHLISPTLKTDGQRLIGNNFIFQQDGARCHTARHSMTWFSSNGTTVLPWPSQSADLNPIAHLRDVTKKKILLKTWRIEKTHFYYLTKYYS